MKSGPSVAEREKKFNELFSIDCYGDVCYVGVCVVCAVMFVLAEPKICTHFVFSLEHSPPGFCKVSSTSHLSYDMHAAHAK